MVLVDVGFHGGERGEGMHVAEDVGDGHGLDIVKGEAVILTVGGVAEEGH